MSNRSVAFLGCSGGSPEPKTVRVITEYIADNQPAELICFEATAPLLEQVREVYDGPIGCHAVSPDLVSRFGVASLPDEHPVAPGWVSLGGNLAGFDTSGIPGNTAFNAARKLSVSVVMGHTHRMGIGSHTFGYGGPNAMTIFGMEVGTLGAGSKVTQPGFGILIPDSDTDYASPETMTITKGRLDDNVPRTGRSEPLRPIDRPYSELMQPVVERLQAAMMERYGAVRLKDRPVNLVGSHRIHE